MKLADAAALVLAGIEATLYCYAFPREHWRCLRTNNPLERLLRKVRRRTRAVRALPDGKSAKRARPHERADKASGVLLGEPIITTRPMPQQMCENFWTLPPNDYVSPTAMPPGVSGMLFTRWPTGANRRILEESPCSITVSSPSP